MEVFFEIQRFTEVVSLSASNDTYRNTDERYCLRARRQ